LQTTVADRINDVLFADHLAECHAAGYGATVLRFRMLANETRMMSWLTSRTSA